jgi:hypothetical protein
MAEEQEEGLVERIAEAIYDARDTQSGDTIGTVIWNSEHLFYETIDGEEIVERARRVCMPVCRDAARAAIAALEATRTPAAPDVVVPRQATDEMISAGIYHCSHDMTVADLHTAWTTMFDTLAMDGGCTSELPARAPDAVNSRGVVEAFDAGIAWEQAGRPGRREDQIAALSAAPATEIGEGVSLLDRVRACVIAAALRARHDGGGEE